MASGTDVVVIVGLPVPPPPVVTVTTAEACLLGSATLIAVTVREEIPEAGTPTRPFVVTVPAVVFQCTATLLVPLTVALNCCVVPAFTVALVGEIATEMLVWLPWATTIEKR